jgi:predicted transcriptional regulator
MATASVLIHPTTVKMDSITKVRLKKLADIRHRKPHWMILEAIHQYLDQEEKRESFRQDAIMAWNEYQATGRHVTAEEADTWLKELENGNEVEPPECHV